MADGQIIDVFTAAGLPKPDISILSDQFLAEVRGLKHKNVAVELLETLLKDELKVRATRNLVQAQLFSEKLKRTLNAYHNPAIATQEVIEELIKLAKDLDAATKRGEDLGLTDDEVAFYDALAANKSAVDAMGDDKLKVIATELISQVRKSVTIDWNLRETARAKDSRAGQAHPEQVGPPAGFAGGGREDSADAGGAALCGVDGSVSLT